MLVPRPDAKPDSGGDAKLKEQPDRGQTALVAVTEMRPQVLPRLCVLPSSNYLLPRLTPLDDRAGRALWINLQHLWASHRRTR